MLPLEADTNGVVCADVTMGGIFEGGGGAAETMYDVGTVVGGGFPGELQLAIVTSGVVV